MVSRLLAVTALSLAFTLPALDAGMAQSTAPTSTAPTSAGPTTPTPAPSPDPLAALQPLADSPRVPYKPARDKAARGAGRGDLSRLDGGRDLGPPPGLDVPAPTNTENISTPPFSAAAGMTPPAAGGGGSPSLPSAPPGLIVPSVPVPPSPPAPPPPPVRP